MDNLTGFINEVGSALTLQKTGAGTWLVNTVANYAGATQVDDGILKIGLTNALPTGTALRVGSGGTGGTLDLNGFDQTVGTLTASTNSGANANNIIIGAANTLSVTGNVILGANVAASTTLVTASGGGSFVNNNDGGTFRVGGATGATNVNTATVDFSGLSNFTVNLGSAGTFQVGDNNTNSSGGPVGSSSLILASTANTITAGTIQLGQGTGQGSSVQTLSLGAGTNTINADTINIGGNTTRSGGAINFASGTGSVVIRGSDGLVTSRTAINMTSGGISTGYNQVNDLLLAGHTADLLVSTLTMANRSANTGAVTSTATFDQGTLDVTTLNMASRTGAGTGDATAIATIGGGTATVGSLTMATNTSAGGTVTADLNVTGGTVTIGTGSGAAINMANAAASRAVTSNMTLTGGDVTVTGNIVRAGGAGTETATVTLGGSALNLSGNSIGDTGKEIAFVAESGMLTGLGELNGGALLTKTTTGVLTLGDGNTYSGGTTISGGTILANNTSGSATGSGAVQVDATGTLGGNGVITVASGGSVTIDGTLSVGQVGDASGVDLALGVSGGGNIILNGTASFDIFSNLETGTLNGATANDLAVVSAADWANIVFGGSSILQVTTTLNTSTWVNGDSWKIFDWTAVGGTAPGAGFATFDLPSLSGLLGWDTSSLYETGVIAIVVVPEPSRALLLLFGLLGLALRRRRTTI